MIVYILKLIAFSFLMNWCVSLQLLNQSFPKGKEKAAAIILALAFGIVAGILVL